MLTVVPGEGSGHEGGKDGSPSLIDEIVREGARRMLAEALQAEVDAYIAAHAAERDENGRRLVVRNGYHQPREILTSAGAVEVTVPRVNDKRTDPGSGERQRFSSAILPPWARKTPKITEVLPLLYLHGLSSGDFVPALGQFLGSAAGLSAAVITRLTETWKGAALARLQPRPGGPPLLAVATGPYVGEGFDCPALDTLFLAAPVANKGSLTQYVGRILRSHENKTTAEVHDYLDERTGVLAAMLAKRAPGYAGLGFPDPRTIALTPSASTAGNQLTAVVISC